MSGSDAVWNIALVLLISEKETVPLCKQTCLSLKSFWNAFFLKWVVYLQLQVVVEDLYQSEAKLLKTTS